MAQIDALAHSPRGLCSRYSQTLLLPLGESNYDIQSDHIFFKDANGKRVGTLKDRDFAYLNHRGRLEYGNYCAINIGETRSIVIARPGVGVKYMTVDSGAGDEFIAAFPAYVQPNSSIGDMGR